MPRVVSLSLAALYLCSGAWAHAAPICAMPEEVDFGPIDTSGRIEVSADRADVTAEGTSEFSGRVSLQRGAQRLETDSAAWDPAAGRVTALAGARYLQPGFEVHAESLEYIPAEGRALLSGTRYYLPLRPARGGAELIEAQERGRISLEGVTYTTCPDDDPDWQLGINRLRLYPEREIGEAERVTMRFMGVPVFYWPYLSFPLSDRRKSGFLVPEFGQSSSNGLEVRAPYYFNLAPNYDYTLAPVLMSKRGLQADNRFRYLTYNSEGMVELDYLPRDDALPDKESRTYFKLAHVTRLETGWRFTAALEDVSDTDYFQDLGTSPQVTSQTHLERLLQAEYAGDIWRIAARMQNFRLLDLDIPEEERPYARLPQVMAEGLWRNSLLGLDWRLRSEAGNFSRDVGPEGGRAMLEPGVSLPLEAQGFFLTPTASLRVVQYRLTDEPAGSDDAPSYTAPILSVDSGLLFDRDLSRGRFVQTFEPRALYAYIPPRDQAGLPLFDTGRPDFNYVQLFRPNRYLGIDRLGDTNQLSLGMTTRVIESESGREFLTASLGKAWYFQDPEVTLPGESPDAAGSSPIVLELGLGWFRHWNGDIAYQWDNSQRNTELAQFRVRYQPAEDKIANLAYRYRPDLLEDIAASFGWPLVRRWSVVGAIEYSLRDKTSVDRLFGVQYDSCCWAVRLAASDQVSRRDGSTTSAIRLQFEFKGLAGVGGDIRSRLGSDMLIDPAYN